MSLHRRQKRPPEVTGRQVRVKVTRYYRQAVRESSCTEGVEMNEYPRGMDQPRTALEEMQGCRTKAARLQLAATYWARSQYLLRDVVTDGEV